MERPEPPASGRWGREPVLPAQASTLCPGTSGGVVLPATCETRDNIAKSLGNMSLCNTPSCPTTSVPPSFLRTTYGTKNTLFLTNLKNIQKRRMYIC